MKNRIISKREIRAPKVTNNNFSTLPQPRKTFTEATQAQEFEQHFREEDENDDLMNSFLTIWAKVLRGKNKIEKQTIFLTELNIEDLQLLYSIKVPTILAGDWNAKHQAWGTRKINQNADLLDFIITKDILNITASLVFGELDSDHYPLLFSILGHYAKTNNPEGTHILNWKKFREFLQNKMNNYHLLSEPISEEKVDGQIDLLNNLLHEAKERCTSLKLHNTNYPPLPKDIQDTITQRNQVRRLFLTYHREENHQLLKQLTKTIKSAIASHESKLWNNYLSTISFEDHTLWHCCKKLNRPNPNITPIEENGKIIFEPKGKAEHFVEYLSTLMRNTFKQYPYDMEVEITNNLLPHLPTLTNNSE
ncbi:hypothetical protein J437_LFUL018515, partial [Ladona fulva]